MRFAISTLAMTLCFGTMTAFAQDQAPAAATAPAGTAAPATAAAPADATAPAAAGSAPASSAPAASADTTATPAPDSSSVAAPAPAIPPEPTNPPSTGPQLLISTSMGDITLQLDSVRAPKSVANILRYVRAKHYDGTVIYRVVKGALIEMGSWDATGKGRPDLPGPKVPLEVRNGLSNLRGSVALARGDAPDSAGAEFFINVGDESPLDAANDVPGKTTGYAVFGQVIAGMAVVDAASKVPVGDKGPMPGEAPVKPILIKKVTIVPGTGSPGGSVANAAKPPGKKSPGP